MGATCFQEGETEPAEAGEKACRHPALTSYQALPGSQYRSQFLPACLPQLQLKPNETETRHPALARSHPLNLPHIVISLHLAQHVHLAGLAHSSPLYLRSQDTSKATDGITEPHSQALLVHFNHTTSGLTLM